jgi:hypothetical protein
MSRWQDRVSGHAVFSYVELILASLDALPTQDDLDRRDDVERVREVASRIRRFLADIDPLLVSPALLDALGGPLQHVPGIVDAYGRDGDAVQLDQANEYCDQALTALGWSLSNAPRNPVGARETAARARTSMRQAAERAEADVNAALARLPALEAAAAAAEARIAAAVTAAESALQKETAAGSADIAAAVSTAESRLIEATRELDAQKVRIDSMSSEFGTSFRTAEAERTKKSDDAIAESRAALDDHIANVTANHEVLRAELIDEAASTVHRLDELRMEAENLVQEIGNRGFSFSFGTYAGEMRKSANIWATVAVLSVGALAVLGGALVLLSIGTTLDPSQVLLRVLVTLPVFALFAFAVRESARHRSLESDARRASLELAAIDPYLANMDKGERDRIKAVLIERMFARESRTAAGAPKSSTASKPEP